MALATACGGMPSTRVLAQSGIIITQQPPPTYVFGASLTFQISATGEAPLDEAVVFFRPVGGAQIVSERADVTPARAVTAAVTIDLTQHLLRPFVSVEYWWEIRDRTGALLTTQIQTFQYEDNRFKWRTLSGGQMTVHWYDGDTAFAQTALDVAAAALPRANQDIQASLPDTLSVYLYRNEPDLRATLKSVGRAWAGGHADPELGAVLIPAAPGAAARATLERLIPHEMTHLLVYTAVGGADAYARVPSWLNEGLAVMNEGRPNPGYAVALAQARDAGTLFSLDDLCGPFPADATQAELAYAQSESFTRYLRARFGPQSLSKLLAAYADGAVCGAGVERALGLAQSEVERGWLQDVVRAAAPALTLQALLPWILVAALALLLPALVAILAVARRRRPTPGPTTPP
jgi:hypothetical protein